MKVIRINVIIDKNYKKKLIQFEDEKIDYLKDYECEDEIIIDNKRVSVNTKISPKVFKAYTHKHKYGDRYLNISVEIKLDKDNIISIKDETVSTYDICYEGYMLKKERDTIYVIKLSFDEVKDIKYMRNKMFYIMDTVEYKKNDNFLEGAFYTKSLTNKIERIELVYLILINKMYKGEFCNILFKKYLKEKFAFNGYDEEFTETIFPSKKDIDTKLDYYISLILKELYNHDKVLNLGEHRYEIDELYTDMIESIIK